MKFRNTLKQALLYVWHEIVYRHCHRDGKRIGKIFFGLFFAHLALFALSCSAKDKSVMLHLLEEPL